MVDPLQNLLWFWGSSLVLAVLLYYPASRLVFVMRIRRMEKKLKRTSTDEEREKERRKSKIITGAIVITFAFLFNKFIFFST